MAKAKYSLSGTNDGAHDYATSVGGAQGCGSTPKRAGVAKFTPGVRSRAGAHQPKKPRNNKGRR